MALCSVRALWAPELRLRMKSIGWMPVAGSSRGGLFCRTSASGASSVNVPVACHGSITDPRLQPPPLRGHHWVHTKATVVLGPSGQQSSCSPVLQGAGFPNSLQLGWGLRFFLSHCLSSPSQGSAPQWSEGSPGTCFPSYALQFPR